MKNPSCPPPPPFVIENHYLRVFFSGSKNHFYIHLADHVKTHAEIRKSSYSQESDIQILPSVTCGECGHAERTQNAMNTHLRLCLAKPRNLDFGCNKCDFQSATIIALSISNYHCTATSKRSMNSKHRCNHVGFTNVVTVKRVINVNSHMIEIGMTN